MSIPCPLSALTERVVVTFDKPIGLIALHLDLFNVDVRSGICALLCLHRHLLHCKRQRVHSCFCCPPIFVRRYFLVNFSLADLLRMS